MDFSTPQPQPLQTVIALLLCRQVHPQESAHVPPAVTLTPPCSQVRGEVTGVVLPVLAALAGWLAVM